MALERLFKAIIADQKLRVPFPEPVLREAERLPQTTSDRKGSVDLTRKTFVTIDGETARDFDDAVYLEAGRDGGWTLWVSIADVSHFVIPGGVLDQEAFRRGTSVYFPGSCIPMLPERLSNDLCSLRPHEVRATFTAEMKISADGAIEKSKFYRSLIRSAARLTYNEVDRAAFKKEPAMRKDLVAVVPLLDEMARLMKVLRRQRLERGSLDFDLPEPLITLNIEDGTPEAILKAPRTEAHMLIEEFMILANEQVAEFLEKGPDFSVRQRISGGSPVRANRRAIYRVHGTPEPGDLKELVDLAHNVGLSLPVHRKIRPQDVVTLLAKARGRPVERLLNIMVLRSLPRAVYDTNNIGHFGLASRSYTHFTSPIRRYPDLIVHRLLEARLKGERSSYTGGQLESIARHSSETEHAAMKAERQVVSLYQTYFMKERVGQEFAGRIAGVTEFGFFVELDDFFVEGLVGRRSLKDDRYRFVANRHALVGTRTKKRYTVGMPVKVRLTGTNLEKRHIDFDLVELPRPSSKW